MEVSESNNKLTISAKNVKEEEAINLDITPFGSMIPRVIHSLYTKGVDELKLTYDGPATFALIQSSLGKQAAGFEILETGKNYCIIKNVSEGTKEFNQVLRQTFILLLSMAEEGYEMIKQGNFNLQDKKSLELANNRFTTYCRRYLNTKGSEEFDKMGPIYYIVEQLEKIADEYKYLYIYLSNFKNEKITIDKELLANFSKVNQMLRKFYNVFYKFSPRLIGELKDDRDGIVKDMLAMPSKIKKQHDIVMYHHLMKMATDIFSLLVPYLVLAIKSEKIYGN